MTFKVQMMTLFCNLVFTLLLINISKYSAEDSDPNILCQIDPRDLTEPSLRWPGGIVPYRIDDGDFEYSYDEDGVRTIQEAIDDWNIQIPEVQFVPRNESHVNSVFIVNDYGCASRVGMKGGVQLIYLVEDGGCLNRHTIHHEMMHAIGFHHEHTRPVRDEFVEVVWSNITYDYKADFIKYNSSIVNPANEFGSYDYYSIMHYPTSYIRKRWMKILKEGVDINKIPSKNLTSLDIEKLQKFYKGEK